MKDILEITKEELNNLTPEQIASIVNDQINRSSSVRKEALEFLYNNGEVLDLGKWVTLKEYKERFGLKSINVLTNWIRRGIIPKENIRVIKELNGIRLVKAIPYKEA